MRASRHLVYALVLFSLFSTGLVRAQDSADRRAPLIPGARPIISCESLSSAALPAGARVTDAHRLEASGKQGELCGVTVEVADSLNPSEVITIWVALPIDGWNGHFLGTGGGGFFGGGLSYAVKDATLGFAAAATDAGHHYLSESKEKKFNVADGSFVLDHGGRLDWSAVEDFSYLGIHDMTVVGKALTKVFYGTAPRYSYFSGCSTGGRQGQSEVQRFPEDYNGVLSGAPAINWTHFLTAAMWGKVTMNELHHVVPQCKLEAARVAVIAACDKLDGVADKVISEPERCTYDPQALVGKETDCGIFNAQDAEVIRRMWDGPRRRDGSRLWVGLPFGGSFQFDTGGDPSGSGDPSGIAMSWFKYFLRQDPSWTPENLTREQFELLFDQSVEEFGDVLDTSRSDLSRYASAGGKTILWHGTIDSNIPTAGTVHYVDAIRKQLGPEETDKFLRFYLAPGIGHCGHGEGAVPVHLFGALVDWVEKGEAPGVLGSEKRDDSGKLLFTRPLCPYPQNISYLPDKPTDIASSFICK